MRWRAPVLAVGIAVFAWQIAAGSAAPPKGDAGSDLAAPKSDASGATDLEDSSSQRKVSEETRKSTVSKFDHEQHAALEKPVDVDDCSVCHGSDEMGNLEKIGEQGHQPCLNAGCHANDFLSVSARVQSSDPERYAAAAAFCAGCHRPSDEQGRAPSPFMKMKADRLFVDNTTPQHHVEMNHLAHAQETSCSHCHVVDKKSFELVADKPGHAECASCHKDEDLSNGKDGKGIRMKECKGCHGQPSPDKYFSERRFDSDVRSCGSARYQELSARRKANIPCFEHEHQGHRFREGGEAVECVDCHFMFESESYQGRAYKTLKDIKQAPLMDNSGDKAHRKCGARGCHPSAVNESSGKGRCGMCHSKASIVGDLFGGGSSRASRRNSQTDTSSQSASSTSSQGNQAGKKLGDETRKANKASDSLFDKSNKRRKRRRNSKSRKRRRKSDLFN